MKAFLLSLLAALAVTVCAAADAGTVQYLAGAASPFPDAPTHVNQSPYLYTTGAAADGNIQGVEKFIGAATHYAIVEWDWSGAVTYVQECALQAGPALPTCPSKQVLFTAIIPYKQFFAVVAVNGSTQQDAGMVGLKPAIVSP